MTTLEFIKRAKEIHGNKYDYSVSIYNKYDEKIKIICPVHGEFEQTPHMHLKGQGCKKCFYYNKGLELTNVIKRAKEIHGNKYDYSLNKNKKYFSEENIKIICPKHGEFEQTIHRHLGQKQGCPRCGKTGRLNNAIFIQRAKEIHGNKYDYSLVEYINSTSKVKIICPKHGEFEQNPRTHLANHGCPKCKSSKGEEEIRKILNNKGIIFEEQKRFEGLKRYPFDFYLPKYNLVIEYQGEQHYNLVNNWGGLKHLEKTKLNDNKKRKFCIDNNIFELEIPYWKFSNIEFIIEELIDER